MLRSEIMETAEYNAVLNAFESGTLIKADRETLQTYITTIAMNATGDDAIQARDIVQALTINHLILQRHIDELERKNNTTQNWIIILTIFSVLGTGMQCWLAHKADERSVAESIAKTSAKVRPLQSLPSSASSH